MPAALVLGLTGALLLGAPGAVEAAAAATPAPATPAAAPASGGSTAAKRPAPPAADTASPLERAWARAKETGRDVPVPELTDEFSTAYATPRHTVRKETSVLQQRIKSGKTGWRSLDDTLAVRADGTVAPKAASSTLVISGGGSGPLATMTSADGKQLAVSSPFAGPLPKPVLRGNDAVFENVAPDTDLQVSATKYGGYTTVVVLRTPAAAADPAVRNLVFPTSTTGLTLTKGADGGLTAGDGKGTAFRAPAPLMWSAGEARTAGKRGSRFADLDAPAAAPASADRPSSADGPGAGASVARIPVTRAKVTGTSRRAAGAIELAPSAALLDGADTRYPIYVDPSWSVDARGKQHHAWVQQAYDSGNFDRTGSDDRDHPGVGFQGWETRTGIERALYEFDLNGYAGATINYANLRLNQYISADWSCTTTHPVHLYRAGAFDGGVKWSNHQIREWIQNQDVPGNGNSGDCYGDIGVDFNVTNAMRDGIKNTGTPLAFALTGQEGTGDKIGFKRFNYGATLSAEYDFPPRKPENPHTSPSPHRVSVPDTDACYEAPLSAYGWITSSSTTLVSKVSSPNQGQLTEYTAIWDNSTGSSMVNTGWSGFVPNNSDASYSLPQGSLKDGHHYGWQTWGDDGLLRGTGSEVCHFAVDLTPPTLQFGRFTDPATQFPPAGNGQITDLRLGDEGSIPVIAADPSPGTGLLSSGLACIRWGYDPQLTSPQQKCGAPLAVTDITTKPTHWGTNVLYAQVLDEAGNASPTQSYAFYVPWKDGPVAFGDTTGDARPDVLLPDTAGNLVTYGRASDGTAASTLPSGTAATALQAPEVSSGRTWKDYRTVHRGSLDPGRNVDDLFVHQEPATIGGLGGDKLFSYDNKLSDPGVFTLGTKNSVTKPDCDPAKGTACTGYHNTPTWQYSSQITPTGPARTTRTPSRQVTDATGLLAVESGNLWFYPVKTNQTLASPTLVDAAGTWDDKDLIVPGNALNIGTATDTAPALWVRNRTSGDIFQYALTTATRAADQYRVVTGITLQPATKVGSGVSGAAFPKVGSEGDVTGDDVPDLWAQDSAGQLRVWPGAATGTAVSGFTGSHVRGYAKAPTVQWRLDGDAKGIPATAAGGGSNDATATGVTYAPMTVDGRTRQVAVFDDAAKSVITGPAKAVDTRQSFTLSTWVKQDKADGVIVSQDQAHASQFMLWADAGYWRFAIARGDDDGWPHDFNEAVSPAGAFKAGVWTQLTATYNATTGAMNLYVNGQLGSTGYHAAAGSPAPSGALVLGRYKYQSQPSNYFKGAIAGLSVYQGTAVPVTTDKLPIRLAASPELCQDAPNSDASNGRAPQLWYCNGSDAQQFSVNANGTLTVKNQCVAASANGTAEGTDLIFWGCTGEGGQQWLPRADGSIWNPQSGRCLDLYQDNRAWGSRFKLWGCNGTTAQQWSIPTLRAPNLPMAP
ncbi:ricin-type beta-trefoil lectin domain protein [Streptomyces sp. NPDC089919]|uniref:ricin-type beta-trefoil lectin domain protein n=1 Tax=Streptomyces sp. NPDC089919 TaxID=3155188 RepID=UPI00341A5F17